LGSGDISLQSGNYLYQPSPSDRKLKTKIRPIDDALDKVMSIRGVYYNWQDNPQYISDGVVPKDDIERERRNIGVIAQDLQQVVPEVVSSVGKEGKYLGVDYASLTALLIEAMKEMHTRIEILEDDVDELFNNRA
jgi:hypothetical protein